MDLAVYSVLTCFYTNHQINELCILPVHGKAENEYFEELAN